MRLYACILLFATASHATVLRMSAFQDIDDSATANLRDFYVVTEYGTSTTDSTGAPSTVRLHKAINGGTDANAYTLRIQPGSGFSRYYGLAQTYSASPIATLCRSVNLHADTLPSGGSNVRRILEMREWDGASGSQVGLYAELKSDGAVQVRYGPSATAIGSATTKHLYPKMCCDTSGGNCDTRIACSGDGDCAGGQCGAAGGLCNSDQTGCYWGGLKLCQTTQRADSVRAVLYWDGRKELDSTFDPGQTARGLVDAYMGAVTADANTPDLYVGSFADEDDPNTSGYGYVATAIPTGLGLIQRWNVDTCGAGLGAVFCVNDWLNGGAFDNNSGGGDRLLSGSQAGRTEQFADSTNVAPTNGETVGGVGVVLVGETTNTTGVIRRIVTRIRACRSATDCDENAGMDQTVDLPTLSAATLWTEAVFPFAPSPSGPVGWTPALVKRLGVSISTGTGNEAPSRLGALLYYIRVLKPTMVLPIIGHDHNLGPDDGKYCAYTFGDSTNAGAVETQCPGGPAQGQYCLYETYCSSPTWDAVTFRDKPVNGCSGNDDTCKTCTARRDDTPTGSGFACDCEDASCSAGTPAYKCQTGSCSAGGTCGSATCCTNNPNVPCIVSDDCTLGDCDYAATCEPSCPDSKCPALAGWGSYVLGKIGADSIVKCGFGSLSSVELAAHLTPGKVLGGTDPSCAALTGSGKCACSSNLDCGACSLTTTQGCMHGVCGAPAPAGHCSNKPAATCTVDANCDNVNCPTGETCTTGTCSSGGSDSRTLQPTADTYMTQSAATTTHDTETILRVGRSGSGANTIMRALLRFDLSSIPYGSTIDSAVLTFTVNARSGSPSAGKLYEMASGRTTWNTAQATWNIYKTCSPTACTWGTGGATNATTDYVPTVYGTHSAPPSSGTFTVTGLEPLVQDALTSRSGKADIVWGLDSNPTGTTYVNVNSTAAASGKPSLAITFHTPVGPPTCTAGPNARTSCQNALSDCNCNGYTDQSCPNPCRLCPPDDIDILWSYNDYAWVLGNSRCRGPGSALHTVQGDICSACGSHALCLSDADCHDQSADSVCLGHSLTSSRTGRMCAGDEPGGRCTATTVGCRKTSECPNGMVCTQTDDAPIAEGHCIASADHWTSCISGSRPTCADDADVTCPLDVYPKDGIHDYAAANGVCRLKCGRCSTHTDRLCATNVDCEGSETCNARSGDADADCKAGTGVGTCNTAVPRVCKGACDCPDSAKACTSNADCVSIHTVRGITRTYAGTCVGAPSGHCSCSGVPWCRLDANCPDAFATFARTGGGHSLPVDEFKAVQALIDALPETDGRPHLYPVTAPIEAPLECRAPGAQYSSTWYLAGANAHFRSEFPNAIDAERIASTVPNLTCHSDYGPHFAPACSELIGGLDAQMHEATGTCATTDASGNPLAQKYCRAVDGTWPESGCVTDSAHCSCSTDADCSSVQTCEPRRCAAICNSSADCVNWFGIGHSCVNGACNKSAGTCSVSTSVKCCLEADCPETETCNGATCSDSCTEDFGTGFAFDGTYCTHASKDRCPASGDECRPE